MSSESSWKDPNFDPNLTEFGEALLQPVSAETLSAIEDRISTLHRDVHRHSVAELAFRDMGSLVIIKKHLEIKWTDVNAEPETYPNAEISIYGRQYDTDPAQHYTVDIHGHVYAGITQDVIEGRFEEAESVEGVQDIFAEQQQALKPAVADELGRYLLRGLQEPVPAGYEGGSLIRSALILAASRGMLANEVEEPKLLIAGDPDSDEPDHVVGDISISAVERNIVQPALLARPKARIEIVKYPHGTEPREVDELTILEDKSTDYRRHEGVPDVGIGMQPITQEQAERVLGLLDFALPRVRRDAAHPDKAD